MKYKLNLLSDWHVGSGLGAGAETDSEVLKDDKNLPYIPGKTIKGLLKDAVKEMEAIGQGGKETINKLFGWEEKDEKGKILRTHNGNLFFSNATLSQEEREEIIPELADFLYRNISQTKIDNKGVAENNSLRTIEICMPITLIGEIKCIKEGTERELTIEESGLILNALKWTRRLGVNRNQGLGRCQFIEL